MTISKGRQAFPRTEYLRRLATVKVEMARRDIEALMINNLPNITYLTGYTAHSGNVPLGIVVSVRNEEPAFILRRMDAPAAIHQTFLERDNVIGYPESLIGSAAKDGFDIVIDSIHDLGLAGRGLGLELDNLSPRAAEKFKVRMPRARIVDCTNVVAWIRIIKSDLEIAVIQEAAAISDAAIMRTAEVLRPGAREADVAAEISATLVRGVDGKPGTSLSDFFFCTSPRTGTPHIAWSEDNICRGSQINLQLSGVRYGYHGPIMRTFSIGAPSERLRRLYDAELAGLEAALSAVRPGATCSEVAGAFRRTIEKLGFRKESRCGFSTGIDWVEPTASLKDGDLTELKPNMTFDLMLGNWIDEDFGCALADTFRVTESGAEVLNRAPRNLFEIQ
ncbi:M24 family metallopeptidase [Sinorhizobium meliloti]|uniref:M24 family metallopeptidase n=1 Tax=Rhizobium meliloti TaxID=382 RepID=UPI00129595FB|nr:Xaa-Pro peptidase family protein [Sinorhizobium meliloti]MQW56136.1 M24 family metallopeptidase [Sinorhizobium meliloti]